MIKCEKCNVEIADNAIVCPLCKNVLNNIPESSESPTDDKCLNTFENININGSTFMYPELKNKIQKRKLAQKIIVFSCFVIEAILILINFLTFNKVESYWSLLTGVVFSYVCFATMYLLKNTNSHRKAIEMMIIGTSIFLILIDVIISFKLDSAGDSFTGAASTVVGEFNAWSFSFGIPCTLLASELIIIMLVIINRKEWQEYILLQIFVCMLSFINLGITLFVFTGKSTLSLISAGVAIAIIAGMITFGNTKAKNEVNRRFKL